jgi:hypothetical protein
MKAWEGVRNTTHTGPGGGSRHARMRDELRPQPVWTLHQREHAAAIDLRRCSVSADIVLTVEGEL